MSNNISKINISKINTIKINPYNEEYAQELLKTNTGECIVYCCKSLPGMFLNKYNKWKILTEENREDILQELCISTIHAINSYNGSTKLMTWIWNRMRYTMLDIGKKEIPYIDFFPSQLDDYNLPDTDTANLDDIDTNMF